MAILLFAEHDNATLSEQTAKALTAASRIGGDIDVLVAGNGAGGAAEAAAKLAGVRRVLLAEGDALEQRLAEPTAALIVALADDYDAIVAPATATGKNVLPRVAALLDVMQVSEVVEVVAPDTFKRPIYAGNALQTVQATDAKKVLTCGPPASPPRRRGTRRRRSRPWTPFPADPGLSSFVENMLSTSDRPELGSARIVISGGRALGSQEKFQEVILPVADKLGAAVGASRAAVDAGYAPNDWQVGQTGKIVAPDLYIACGISGAIQHLAGMKDSKVIVAINKDEDAPIFQVADYGLVGDLFELLPELERQLLSGIPRTCLPVQPQPNHAQDSHDLDVSSAGGSPHECQHHRRQGLCGRPRRADRRLRFRAVGTGGKPAGPRGRPRRERPGERGLRAQQGQDGPQGRHGQLRACPARGGHPGRAAEADRRAERRRRGRRHPRPASLAVPPRLPGGDLGHRPGQGCRRTASDQCRPSRLGPSGTRFLHASRLPDAAAVRAGQPRRSGRDRGRPIDPGRQADGPAAAGRELHRHRRAFPHARPRGEGRPVGHRRRGGGAGRDDQGGLDQAGRDGDRRRDEPDRPRRTRPRWSGMSSSR